jgi:thiol-disulfide isomerase/thioredoxin
MKKILLLIAGFAIIACSTEPKEKIDYTLVSGKINNKADSKIIIHDSNGFLKRITLNEDGTFQDTLRVDAGYFILAHESNSANIFLSPAKDLQITTDAKHFIDSMRYEGKATAANNFLLEKSRRNKKLNPDEIYAMDEAKFIQKMTEIKEVSVKKLAEATDLDEEFVTLEKKNLKFVHLLNISRYPYFAVNYYERKDYKPSEDYKAIFKDIDYDNEENFNTYKVYRDLATSHYAEKIDPENDIEGAMEIVKNLKSKSLKENIIEELAYLVSPSFNNSEYLYKSLTEISTDENLKKELTKKYTTMQNLVAGKDSPAFDYENHKGGTTSLADLAGKYVYIDVWATWCGPCIAEIPSLKKVEKQYHDKNIAFVSISIDELKDHDKWKKMVTEKELGGIQLMADNAWKSKFVADYAIEGIPRFILIDPNGKITNADAPRPSDPKLIELFDELKI